MKDSFEGRIDEVEIGIAEARELVARAFAATGFTADEAAIITDQIIECELRGVPNAGLSRALTLVDVARRCPPHAPITVTRETSVSALVEGGGHCGYLVAHRAVELGIEKALAHGIAVISARDTAYTGMYVHYLESAARAGLVGMAAGNSGARVAPYGATQARMGTNPIAFAFPTDSDPVIFDTGTSSVVLSELHLARRLGLEIGEGLAFDADGIPTRDPAAALAGAITVWGGYRGSGLSVAVQLLGILAGGDVQPTDESGSGFLFVAIRPDLFGEPGEFERRALEFADYARSAEPVPGGAPVRLPFDRSAQTRRELVVAGRFPASARVVAALRELAGEGSVSPRS
ncbi:Ldh family oxidoreductase [Microbacterium sp.]|uniref:Ldh family oxidoreductase n=1 Tax=Microbacterium sp. TaxID=51671 RepID=UPI0039E2432D